MSHKSHQQAGCSHALFSTLQVSCSPHSRHAKTKHQVAIDATDDFEKEEAEQYNPDAGEGAKAKAEEGTVSNNDATASSTTLYSGEVPPPTSAKMDKVEATSEVVDNTILFQSLEVLKSEAPAHEDFGGTVLRRR